MGDEHAHNIKQHWDQFYSQWKNRIPSQFASLVATEVANPSVIVDIGCGNGRDTFFFASLGHKVYGLDRSETAIELNAREAAELHLNNCYFWQVDVGQFHPMTASLRKATAATSTDLPLVIYARFFMHAINDMDEATFFSALRAEAPPGAKIFLEFRNDQDEHLRKAFGQHFRRFVNSQELSARLTAENKIGVIYQIDGQGMAKYRDEDPFVSRIIARVS